MSDGHVSIEWCISSSISPLVLFVTSVLSVLNYMSFPSVLSVLSVLSSRLCCWLSHCPSSLLHPSEASLRECGLWHVLPA